MTDPPTARGTLRQRVEAFPYDSARREIVRDRDDDHRIRTHRSLDEDAAVRRGLEAGAGAVIALSMVGGLHHRWVRRAA